MAPSSDMCGKLSLPFSPTNSFFVPCHPISLDKIAESGQCFRWCKMPDGSYVIPASGHLAHVNYRERSGELLVEHDGPSNRFWQIYLDLDRDYSTVIGQLAHLPKMDSILEFGEGLRVLNQPFFETCISYLISQNNNITRIRNTVEKICGGALEPFPDGEKLQLRLASQNFGLGYRGSYIDGFCKVYQQGELADIESLSPLSSSPSASLLSHGEAHAKLLSFTGIGEKVASCIEAYSLGYAAALPKDVWIRRAEDEFGITWNDEFAAIQQLFVFYAIRNKAIS